MASGALDVRRRPMRGLSPAAAPRSPGTGSVAGRATPSV